MLIRPMQFFPSLRVSSKAPAVMLCSIGNDRSAFRRYLACAFIATFIGASLVMGFARALAADSFEDALAAYFRRDYPTALRLYRRLADQGDVAAQTNLGGMYDEGKGVPQNYAEAIKWYRLAAEQGAGMAQTNIGVMYAMGHGVPQNYLEALKWYRLAADQGEVLAQYYLGGMYGYGLGVPQNYNSALMWFILAAAQGNQPALKDRDKIARLMTREQIAEAQRQAAGWAPKTASRIADLPQNPSPRKTEMAASLGTGFFVSTASEFLTNAHVVEGCREIRVNGSRARLLARDDKNDLALIEANSEDAIEAINALVREPRTAWRTPVQLGEEIVVYGFPLPGVLSTDGNVAMGNVTALAGLEDDARFLQISAPVQSGNSGGPVFDRYGNVIGVVVAKLDAFKVASAVGDVPQNVNFAIKASVAIPFLKANHVHFSEPPINAKSLSTPEISKLAKKITAQVVCSH